MKFKVSAENMLEFSGFDHSRKYKDIPTNFKLMIREVAGEISANSYVIKLKEKTSNYVLDFNKKESKIVVVEIESFDKGNLVLEIKQIIPNKGDDIENYFIYKSNFPQLGDNLTYFFNGNERKILSGDKLKKWDYFFRASPDKLAREFGAANEFIATETSRLRKIFVKYSLILLTSVIAPIILLFSLLAPIIAIVITIILFSSFRRKIKEVFKKQIVKNLFLFNLLNKISKSLEGKYEQLIAKIDQTQITDEEIAELLNSELLNFERLIINELGLEGMEKEFATINDLKRLKELSLRNTKGFSIEEWGFLQDKNISGKEFFTKDIQRNHMYAFRRNPFDPNGNIFGVYYVTFIYLTYETIRFSSFFYDFITEERRGMRTSQYYYSDIVSIGTNVRRSEIWNSLELDETQQILVSFTNGERLSITLTDSVTIDSLYEYISKKSDEQECVDFNKKLPSSEDSRLEPIMANTKANAILTEIRANWNSKKI